MQILAKAKSYNLLFFLLLLLVAVNSIMISTLLFQPVVQTLGLIFLCAGLLIGLRFYLEAILYPAIIILAGTLGMLTGSILDFGSLGLINLASLCANNDNTNLQGLVNIILLAPATHIGMWLSCTLALIAIDNCRHIKQHHYCHAIKHLTCLAGMLMGMWLTRFLPLPLSINGFTTYSPLVNMWLGMSLGMLAALYVYDYFENTKTLHTKSV